MGNVEETTNSMNSLGSSIAQTTGGLTILTAVLQQVNRALPIREVRQLEHSYGSLLRTLTLTSTGVAALQKNVEQLSRVTKYYSQVELTNIIAKFKESTSALSLFTTSHEKLVGTLSRAYGKDMPQFLSALDSVSKSMPILTARINSASTSLATYYELLSKGGPEALSAFEAATGRMGNAAEKNIGNIEGLITRIGVKLENLKASIGGGVSSGVGGLSSLLGMGGGQKFGGEVLANLGTIGSIAGGGYIAKSVFANLRQLLPGGGGGGKQEEKETTKTLGREIGSSVKESLKGVGKEIGEQTVISAERKQLIRGPKAPGVSRFAPSVLGYPTPPPVEVEPVAPMVPMGPVQRQGRFQRFGRFAGRFARGPGGQIAMGTIGALGYSAGLAAQQEATARGEDISAASRIVSILGAGLAGGAIGAQFGGVGAPVGATAAMVVESGRQIYNAIEELKKAKSPESRREIAKLEREQMYRRFYGGTGFEQQQRKAETAKTGYEETMAMGEAASRLARGRQKALEDAQKGLIQLPKELAASFRKEMTIAFKESIEYFQRGMAIAQAQLGRSEQVLGFAERSGISFYGGPSSNTPGGSRLRIDSKFFRGHIERATKEAQSARDTALIEIERINKLGAKASPADLSARTQAVTAYYTATEKKANLATKEQQLERSNLTIASAEVQLTTQKLGLTKGFKEAQESRQKEVDLGKKAIVNTRNEIGILERKIEKEKDEDLRTAYEINLRKARQQLLKDEITNEQRKLDIAQRANAVAQAKETAGVNIFAMLGGQSPEVQMRQYELAIKNLERDKATAPKEQQELFDEKIKEAQARKDIFESVEKPRIERQQEISMKQARLQVFGDPGAVGRGKILQDQLDDQLKTYEALKEAAKAHGEVVDKFRKKQIENDIRITKLNIEINKRFREPLETLDSEAQLIRTRIDLLRTLHAPMGAIAALQREGLENSKKALEIDRAELQFLLSKPDDVKTQKQILDLKNKIAARELDIAKQVDFQRRSYAEMFTEQMLNLPTGSYLNPTMVSGFALQGQSYMTGVSQNPFMGGRGTYQTQIAGVYGEGVSERSTWEETIARLLGGILDVRITNPNDNAAEGAAGGR